MIIENQGELLQPKTLAPRIFNYLKRYVNELMPHQKVVVLSFNDYLFSSFVPMSNHGYTGDEKLPSHLIVPCVRFIVTKKFHLLGSLFFHQEYFSRDCEKFSKDIAECIKLYILALQNINLRVIATVCPLTTVFHRSVEILTKVPLMENHDGPLMYSVGKNKDIVHIHDPLFVRDSCLRLFLLFDLDFVLNGKEFEASRYDIIEVIELGEVPKTIQKPSTNKKYFQNVSFYYINEEISSSIRTLIKQKYLSPDCIGTSLFINMFRQLYHRIYGLNNEKCEMFNFRRMNEYIDFIKSIRPTPRQFYDDGVDHLQDTAASLPPNFRQPKSKIDLDALNEAVQEIPIYSSIYPQEPKLLSTMEQDCRNVLISTETSNAFLTLDPERGNSKTRRKNRKDRRKERNRKPNVKPHVEAVHEKKPENPSILTDHNYSKPSLKKGSKTKKKKPELSKDMVEPTSDKDVEIKTLQTKNLHEHIRQYKNSNKNISTAVRKIDLDNECNKENITENIIPNRPNSANLEVEEMDWETTDELREIFPDESNETQFADDALSELEQTLQIRDEMFARQTVATVFQNYFSKDQIKNLMTIDPILENSPKFDSFVQYLKNRNSQYFDILSKDNEEKTNIQNEQPPTSNEQPATSNQQPPTSHEQPTTSDKQPPASNEQSSFSEQPTTSNQQPPTSHEQLTLDKQPSTSHEQPTTSDKQSPISNEQPPTSNEQPRTSNQQPPKELSTAPNEQLPTSNVQSSISNKQPTTSNQQPPISHEQPTSDKQPPSNKQTKTSNQQPPTSNEQLPTSHEQPTSDKQPPSNEQTKTSNQQPPTSHEQPTSDKQPPSNEQPTTSNLQTPTSIEQPPTSNEQPPTSKVQSPTSNKQPTTSNQQPPTSNEQHPTSTEHHKTSGSSSEKVKDDECGKVASIPDPTSVELNKKDKCEGIKDTRSATNSRQSKKKKDFGGARIVGVVPKTTAFITDVFGNRIDLPELSVPQSVLKKELLIYEDCHDEADANNQIPQNISRTEKSFKAPEKVNLDISDSSSNDSMAHIAKAQSHIDNCSRDLKNLNLTQNELDAHCGEASSSFVEKTKAYQKSVDNAEFKKPTYYPPTSSMPFVDYSQEDTRYLQGGFSSGSEGDFEYQLYEDSKEDPVNPNSSSLTDPSDFNSEFDDYDDLILSKHVKMIINRLEEKDEEICKKIEKKNSAKPPPGPDKSQESKRGYVKKEISPADETGEKRTIFHRNKTEEPAAAPTNVIKNSENNCDKSKIDSTRELYKETLGSKSRKKMASIKDEQYKNVATAISQTIQKFANIFNLPDTDAEKELISKASLEFVYNLKDASSTMDDAKKKEMVNYAYDKMCLSVLGRKYVVDTNAQDKMMELIPILHEIASPDVTTERDLCQVDEPTSSAKPEETDDIHSNYVRDESRNLWINNIKGIDIIFQRLNAEGICQGIRADIFKTEHVENIMTHIQLNGCNPATLPLSDNCSPIDVFECFETFKPFGSIILVEDL